MKREKMCWLQFLNLGFILLTIWGVIMVYNGAKGVESTARAGTYLINQYSPYSILAINFIAVTWFVETSLATSIQIIGSGIFLAGLLFFINLYYFNQDTSVSEISKQPIEILKLKLVNGEITEEEFLRKKNLIE